MLHLCRKFQIVLLVQKLGDFSEWVDFACVIGKGLCLQPAQQACFFSQTTRRKREKNAHFRCPYKNNLSNKLMKTSDIIGTNGGTIVNELKKTNIYLIF